MKIQVSQAHIARGARNSYCRCPIALAINDVFPFARRGGKYLPAGITEYTISIGPANFDPPPEVTAFVMAFDNDDPVQPFEFEL